MHPDQKRFRALFDRAHKAMNDGTWKHNCHTSALMCQIAGNTSGGVLLIAIVDTIYLIERGVQIHPRDFADHYYNLSLFGDSLCEEYSIKGRKKKQAIQSLMDKGIIELEGFNLVFRPNVAYKLLKEKFE